MDDKTEVIFNETCPVCSREVAAYQRVTDAAGLPVAYHGITSDKAQELGLSPDDAARRFHVLQNGELVSGVPAFAVLWDQMPRFRWLARLVRLPVISGLAALVYDHILSPVLFAWHKRRHARS